MKVNPGMINIIFNILQSHVCDDESLTNLAALEDDIRQGLSMPPRDPREKVIITDSVGILHIRNTSTPEDKITFHFGLEARDKALQEAKLLREEKEKLTEEVKSWSDKEIGDYCARALTMKRWKWDIAAKEGRLRKKKTLFLYLTSILKSITNMQEYSEVVTSIVNKVLVANKGRELPTVSLDDYGASLFIEWKLPNGSFTLKFSVSGELFGRWAFTSRDNRRILEGRWFPEGGDSLPREFQALM